MARTYFHWILLKKGSFLAFFLLYVCSKKQLKESIIVENKYDFCCSVSLIVQHEGSQTREPTYSFCTRVSSAKLRLKSKHNSLKVHCTSLFVELFSFNFIYSEKATKFCEIFTLLLSYVVPVTSKVNVSQNYVAFSEYMNFNSPTRKRVHIFCFQFSEPLKHCSFASPFMLRASLQENVKRLSLEQLHFSASILFPKKEL